MLLVWYYTQRCSSSSLQSWEYGDHFGRHFWNFAAKWCIWLKFDISISFLFSKNIHLHTLFVILSYILANIWHFGVYRYFGRHLGFPTLRVFRKNATLIFIKAYDIFFQNLVSFCFYQKKYTTLIFMTNEPTLYHKHHLYTTLTWGGIWISYVHIVFRGALFEQEVLTHSKILAHLPYLLTIEASC